MFNRRSLAFGAAATLLFPGLSHAQVTVIDRLAAGQPPVIVSHRALGAGFPENALAGIQHAIENGIDMVKIDVQRTRDGQYVLMHDPVLNRTTNVEAVFPQGPPGGLTREKRGDRDYISDYALADIKRLRLVDGRDGGDHPVPTLQDALDLIDGRLLVALDLKSYDLDSIVAVLKGRDTRNLLFFGIYYHDPTLLHDVAAAVGIRTFIAMPRSMDYAADLEKLADSLGPLLAMVSVRSRRLSPDVFAKARELGIALCISGMDDEDLDLRYKADPGPWQDALDSGAAAFMTDEPDALQKLLNR